MVWLEENVKNNYYARFDTRSYQSYRETHCNARLDVNSDKISGMQNLGQGQRIIVRCLKSMSRTIIMHGWTLAAITAIEKHTLMLDST